MNTIKHFEKVDGIKPKIYYHYTSLESLYSIINSKSFRLTSLKSSNDRKELYYSFSMFLDDMKNITSNEIDLLLRKKYEVIINAIENNTSYNKKMTKIKREPCALCLSDKRDNLTHWDRYAANCTGVCICLNTSFLNVLLQRTGIDIFGLGLYSIGKVIYNKQDRLDRINQFYKGFIKNYTSNPYLSNIDIDHILLEDGHILAGSAYESVGIFVKNDSYIDEDEVRLYHDSNSILSILSLIESGKEVFDYNQYKTYREGFDKIINGLKIDEQHFYYSHKGIREYRNMNLEEIWGSGVIPEIILGPMCVQNKDELKRFLKANGLGKTKISISKVPIR